MFTRGFSCTITQVLRHPRQVKSKWSLGVAVRRRDVASGTRTYKATYWRQGQLNDTLFVVQQAPAYKELSKNSGLPHACCQRPDNNTVVTFNMLTHTFAWLDTSLLMNMSLYIGESGFLEIQLS